MKKIQDLDASQQTDELKLELYKLTLQFVSKCWLLNYANIKKVASSQGVSKEELAMQFYADFLTPKGRTDVKESLLDKFDPTKPGATNSLPYLVKVSVQRKCIDYIRAHENTAVNTDLVAENTSGSSDEDGSMTGEDVLSSMQLKNNGNTWEEPYDDTYSDEEQEAFTNAYNSLSEEQKEKAVYLYKHYGKRMSPKVREMMEELVGDSFVPGVKINCMSKVADSVNFSLDARIKKLKDSLTDGKDLTKEEIEIMRKELDNLQYLKEEEKETDPITVEDITAEDMWDFVGFLKGKVAVPALMYRFSSEREYEDFMFALQDEWFEDYENTRLLDSVDYRIKLSKIV